MSCARYALLALLVTAPLAAQSYQDLHDFACSSGCQPYGRLTQGSNGNLYGTTASGGANNLGTLFMVTTTGTPYTVLWNFDSTTGAPTGGLTLASHDGNFYGATTGTLFRFNPTTAVFTVLHDFNSATEGIPQGPPVEATNKNLYGLATLGANGAPYSLTIATETFALLPKTVSGRPSGPLVLGSDGYLYGTTVSGGSSEAGLVFRLTTAGAVKKLYSFLDESDGATPNAPLVSGIKDGNLYGTAYNGGFNADGRYGTIFQVTVPTYDFTALFNFDGSTDGGSNPEAGLLSASDGNFYGTTYLGGLDGIGTIFEFAGGSYIPLFDFTGNGGPASGASPNTALVEHTNGLFYGLTPAGGASGGGVFYTVSPPNPSSHIELCCNWWVVLDQPVTILGQNLTGVVNVSFGSAAARFQQGSNTYLTAYVPSTAIDAPVTVTLATGLQVESAQSARILPKITNLDPSSGRVGSQVSIVGGGFAGATKVTFGGVAAASFTIVTPALITATVPAGAKTGHVGVQTPNGTAHSKATFTVN